MSSGRKVTVTLTQAEASALLAAAHQRLVAMPRWDSKNEHLCALAARDKLTHQLTAVRGKVGAA